MIFDQNLLLVPPPLKHVKYGVNGETVTSLPLGSNFANFVNSRTTNFVIFCLKISYEL